MMIVDKKIAVVGYAVILPASQRHSMQGLAPNFGSDVQPVTRRHRRFACRSGEHAITACRLAFDMAGIDPEQVGERFGLYVNQAGHQHGDIDDFQPAFEYTQAGETTIGSLWNSKRLNPFLAVKGLSNNILGLISVLWSFRGDCCAFVRDQSGAASALDEAMFNLGHGYIDTALVLTAGTRIDDLERIGQQINCENAQHIEITGHEFGKECGAVALILQRREANGSQVLAELDNLTHEFRGRSKIAVSSIQGSPEAHSDDLRVILKTQYYFNKSEPRWGGILFSLAQLIHALRESRQRPSIQVHSRDCKGFNASVNVRVMQEY